MSSSTIIELQEYSQPIAMHSLIIPASNIASSPSTNGSQSSSPAEHIKRPPNAFMLFRSAELRREGGPTERTQHQEILSRVIGSTWRRMTVSQQQPFIAAAAAAKREHRRRYPDYKFTPAKKRTGKAKAPKTASKVSDEEITQIRMQCTNIWGPEISKPRKAKKARAVKANARAPPRASGESASTSAFVPVAVPEIAQAPAAFAVPAPQVPFSWPAGLLPFENSAPKGAECGAGPFPFFPIDPYTQSMFNAQQQYDIGPTFRNESHYNNAMWDPASAIPSLFPVARRTPFNNEEPLQYDSMTAFNLGSDASFAMPSPTGSYMDSSSSSGMSSPTGSCVDLLSSSGMHPPAGSYDMGSTSSAGMPSPSGSSFDYSSVLASPGGSAPYDATADLTERMAALGHENYPAQNFPAQYPSAPNFFDQSGYAGSQDGF